MYKRIILDIALFASVFFAPIYVTIILALIGLFFFKNFYEFIIVFVLEDLVFGLREARFFNLMFLPTTAAIIVFWLTNLIKKRLFYNYD